MEEYKVNKQIVTNPVSVIDEDGKRIGIMDLNRALAFATERGLDLLEVNAGVCKLVDYGKFIYENSKKQRKKYKYQEVKEIWLTPRIASHDLETKIKSINRLLDNGHQVRLVMKFSNREMNNTNNGMLVLKNLVESISDIKIEDKPKMLGKQIIVLIGRK